MRKRFLLMGWVVGVLGLGGICAGGDFKLEIGWGTTRVSGPVFGDGTIDYEKAAAEAGKVGVTEENNADVLMEMVRGMWVDDAKGMDAAAYDRLSREEDVAKGRPWKEGEFKDLAAWLKVNEKAMAIGVEGSRRMRFFPVRGKTGRVIMSQGSMRMLGEALCLRAMLRAGSGDVKGAREDVAAVHRLAWLEGQGKGIVDFMIATALEKLALQADLGAVEGLSGEEARGWVAGRVVLPRMSMREGVDGEERYQVLENVMLMVGGHYEEGLENATLLDLAHFFSGKVRNEAAGEGDLAGVDWNVVLRRVNEVMDEEVGIVREMDLVKRREKMRGFLEEMGKEKVPLSWLDVVSGAMFKPGEDMEKQREKLAGEVEGFLKRREGESAADYSRRLAGLFVHAATMGRILEFDGRAAAMADLYRAAFGLEKFRLAHEDYPEKLEEVVPGYLTAEEVVDPYSGERFKYRRDGASGYVVYSVGMNGKDDFGERDGRERDDVVVKGERVENK